jgi:hypothetical protein
MFLLSSLSPAAFTTTETSEMFVQILVSHGKNNIKIYLYMSRLIKIEFLSVDILV